MPLPSPSSEENHFLTADEVAPILRTTTRTVLRLCRAGKLPATKPAGTWLIPAGEFREYLRKSRNDEQGAA